MLGGVGRSEPRVRDPSVASTGFTAHHQGLCCLGSEGCRRTSKVHETEDAGMARRSEKKH